MRIVRGVSLHLALLVAVLVMGTAPMSGWGCKGHQTVALIAEKQLTPEARQFVDKLLSENPIDAKQPRSRADSLR